ncbi:ABC transporter permease [Nonomuraea longicatena]|uniref:ABC transporter permease subunit n=1 Tax=Nonomuraea longicatena TaxID=83682 RepID=A0ABP3ZCJ7_9ACTN
MAVWQAMAAEWTKLWSVRSTWYLLAGAAGLLVLGAVTIGGAAASGGERVPVSEPVVGSTSFAQFALVALAMLTVTSEYSSGTIRSSLQAVPVRGLMLAAKALVLVPVMALAGIVSGAVATAAVYALLSAEQFGGPGPVSLGEVVSDLLGVGVYSAAVALITLGAGAAARSAAGTLTVMFMLLMGLPLMLMMTGSPALLEISARLPMFAGLAFMESVENLTGGPIPYGAGEGFGWLLAWTAAALAAGYTVLRRRDA